MREMSFAAARFSPRQRDVRRSPTASRLARPRRVRTNGSPALRGLPEELDDLREGGPGSEDLPDARLLELRAVVLGKDASPRDDDTPGPATLEELHDLREERHVRPAQARQADRVDVLLDRRLDDVLRGLPQTRVDALYPRIAERAGDHLRTAVVPVEARFRNEDSDLLRHRDLSVQERLLPDPEHLAHDAADLAEGRPPRCRFVYDEGRDVDCHARLPQPV